MTDDRGITARIHDLPAAPRRLLIAALFVAYAALSWWSLTSTTPDLPIALWWPATAFAVAIAAASRGRRIGVLVAILLLVVGLNALYGRPLELSVAYGLANAAETWVVYGMLTRTRDRPRLVTLPDAGWLLISAAAGGAVIAAIAGGAAAALVGADLFTVVFSVFASHTAALFAILPVFLVPLTVPFRVPLWELFAQSSALVVLTFVVFAPAATLGLTFLIITTLMWGAFRLPPLVPAIQTILLAFVASFATALSVGPFAEIVNHDVRGAIIALQLFIMTHAAAGLFVAGQAHDWIATTEALAARERDAQRVADELRHLNQQKDDFISAVSHELRTPVTSIIGFSEMLLEQETEAEVVQAGQVIHRNARRLADVIEDVLELSRLSTQRSSTRLSETVDIAHLLRTCVEDVVGIIPSGRGVTVTLVGAEHPITIRAVEQDLVRIFSNLLSNAVKFSPVGGTVTVTVSGHPDGVEVTITDEGPGVPLSEQEAIWDRFYRVQSPAHSGVPGTGLGLPIVRSLMHDRVGGTVTLESDGVRGTTVITRIPRQPMATAPIQLPG